ncbi:MAG: helix-turn-helix transcriptional regulator [Planctomycetota bacterium]
MNYTPRAPAAGLSPFVESFFHLSDYSPEHSFERIVPDGSSNLVIELDNQTRSLVDNESLEPRASFRGAWLSGPHDEYFSIRSVADGELAAVRFHPAGMYALVKSSMEDLSNRVQAAETLLGESIQGLREEILRAKDAETKLDAIEEWLSVHVDPDGKPPREIESALDSMRGDPTISTVQTVIDESGLSRKHFTQVFKKYVGVTPKRFQRILRFSQALTQIQSNEKIHWSALSVDCGYSDQAHFIKDFQRFSGFNPSEFLAVNSDRLNFFPIDSEDPED